MSHTDSPFALSDALVDALAFLRPSMATFMGVSGQDHRWENLSPEGVAHVASELAAWRVRVDALPPQSERWATLAVHIARDWLEQELDAIKHRDSEVDLNSIASSLQNLRLTFDSMDTSSIAAWANMASRLEGLPVALENYRRSLALGLSNRNVVAQRQVKAAISQARIHAGEQSYFRQLTQVFAKTSLQDSALAQRIEGAIPGACGAYAMLGDWLENDYLPHAHVHDGVGRERYLREMRKFLGSTPDPEETYAWGWTEVQRIYEQMGKLAETISPGKSVRDVLELLAKDPSRGAPDRASFIAVMAERQRMALAELDQTHFDIPDCIRRIDVKEAPPNGTLGAYYVPPSEDFSRAGTVWYLLHGDGPFPLWDEISTAYHEGFPGHHLQCGTQVSLTANLSRLHRVAYGYSGYAEGWALYVEQLMLELGYYEKPEYEFGMLANQMMRACRVVIDIGSHVGLPIPNNAMFHPGETWTFDLGSEMMQTLGGMSPEHAQSEMTRYLGWPAQAISYKVGQRAMLSLREEFLRNPNNTLKQFHSRVLTCGNVGLDLLREQVITPAVTTP
jgi:uncharacterized protein (DUF885 family)